MNCAHHNPPNLPVTCCVKEAPLLCCCWCQGPIIEPLLSTIISRINHSWVGWFHCAASNNSPNFPEVSRRAILFSPTFSEHYFIISQVVQGGNSIPVLRKNLELHRSPFTECRQIVLKADKGSGTPVSSANLEKCMSFWRVVFLPVGKTF